MLTLLRRFLSLCALLFWQGGFTFYAAVVVPAAGKVLAFDLHLRARITDQVVSWLNGAGVVVLALLLWDQMAAGGSSRRLRRTRGVCWGVMAVTLGVLFALHVWLKALDPLQGTGPTDRATFVAVHSAYLCTSTLQWLAALTWMAVSLAVWRREDAALCGPSFRTMPQQNEAAAGVTPHDLAVRQAGTGGTGGGVRTAANRPNDDAHDGGIRGD